MGAGLGGLALDAVEELRAHEQALERELDSRVEAPFGAAHFVERHEVGDVGVRYRPPISPVRERAQDFVSAWHFFGWAARLADEDAAAARRVPGPGRGIRSANRRHRDRGQRAAAAHAAPCDALVERLGAFDERDADEMRARRE